MATEKVNVDSEYCPIYTETTDGVRVSVCPQYLDDETDVYRSVYAFAYTVTIENVGDAKVQLLNRHWVVHSGGAQYSEVKGDGVVGEQPVLEAGDGFQYTSWSVIKDPIGSMQGTYTFKADGEKFFEVKIPKFDLVNDLKIH